LIAGSVFSSTVAVVISDTKHIKHVAVSCRLCPVPVGHRVSISILNQRHWLRTMQFARVSAKKGIERASSNCADECHQHPGVFS
jgi:hypothetical protein